MKANKVVSLFTLVVCEHNDCPFLFGSAYYDVVTAADIEASPTDAEGRSNRLYQSVYATPMFKGAQKATDI